MPLRFRFRRRPSGARRAAGLARAGGAPKLLHQVRAHGADVENRFEPAGRQFVDLLVRQIDAVPLGDAGPDVAHDLRDVRVLGLGHGLRGRLWPSRSVLLGAPFVAFFSAPLGVPLGVPLGMSIPGSLVAASIGAAPAPVGSAMPAVRRR